MQLEISEETVIMLMNDIFISDYLHCRESIKRLKEIKKENGKLTIWQEEDYQTYKRDMKGFKILAGYYLTLEQQEGLK